MVKQAIQQEFPDFPKGKAILMPDGSEVLDPRPVALPVGFERPESIQEMIKRLVTDPLIREEMAASQIVDSFEDADDFNIPGDDPISPHEESFDPMHLGAREDEIRAGAAQDRSLEEKAAAAELLKEYAAKKAADKLAKKSNSTST